MLESTIKWYFMGDFIQSVLSTTFLKGKTPMSLKYQWNNLTMSLRRNGWNKDTLECEERSG